jgi:DNA invertase Pin-like site-specific DNA recombinase
MSSDKQEASPEQQREAINAYAEAHGYAITAWYEDDGISGGKSDREAFQRLIADAERGAFAAIICWDQDRFSRFPPLEANHYWCLLDRAGVHIATVVQGRLKFDDLGEWLKASVTQHAKSEFLRDLARNTVRGMLSSAKAGRAGTGGPSPYGYRSSNGEVRIVPEEAKVVRWIFAEYLTPGGSLRGIAAALNRRKIPPPRGRVWRISSVRAILKRRKYTGTFVYGEQNAGNYYCWRDGQIVPRRKSDKTVQSDPIVIPNKFEAIVDQKTFEQSQAKMESQKPKTAPRKARQYLLSGLVRCGDCEGGMSGRMQSGSPIYRCSKYHQTGKTACYCNTIKESPLLSVIVRNIQERYLSEPALDRLREAIEKEQQRTKPRPRDLKKLKVEIETRNRKIDRAEDTVLDAPDELRPGLYRKLQGLKAERDRLNAELASMSRPETRSKEQDRAEVDRAIEAMRDLGKSLRRAKPEDTKELLSSIVTRIELHFTDGTGKTKRDFTHGTIYLRPDAGGGWGTSPSPDVTHLITKGLILEQRLPPVDHSQTTR